MEYLLKPWPWFVVGPLIAIVMLTLLYFGKTFGLSSNLRTMCAIGGAGKYSEFFRFDWKTQKWNLVFIGGVALGALFTNTYLEDSNPLILSQETIDDLKMLGIKEPGKNLGPKEIFHWESITTLRGFIMIIVGGFLVGFGTRYAGGCTSGHAISGLSDLQLPSLIAVIGFFIGGLLMTYMILPWVLKL